MIARRRIEVDILEINHAEKDYDILYADPVDDNYSHIEAAIRGPDSTPFEGCIFLIDLRLREDFPFAPPERVTFRHAIFHPNITESGEFIATFLTKEWSPAITIKSLLKNVVYCLAVPDMDSNECDSTPAKLYRNDKTEFEAEARKYAQEHAIPS